MIDVSDYFEKLVTAEGLYKSQGHDEKYSRRRIELSLGPTGQFGGVPYAEGFVQEKPQTLTHIELSKYTIARTPSNPSLSKHSKS